jgi:signal transduction histidine kinase
MKRSNKHRTILLMMIISQALLSLFVIYWLRSQYLSEKERLSNDLAGLYIDTQDEVVDTLLFHSYVNPVLSGSRNIEIDSLITLKDTVNNKLIHIARPHRSIYGFRGTKGSVTVRMEAASHNLPDTLKIRRINDEMILRSVKLIVSHTRDSSNRGDSVIRSLNVLPDSAVFMRHFQARLDSSGLKFNLQWERKNQSPVQPHRSLLKLDIANPFSLPPVNVSGFRGYLISEIFPQILFGLVLIIITALAFIFSYRSIRDHVVLGRLRNEFISNITHELKTPVATIGVALESLSKYNMRDKPEVMDEYLRLAMSENSRLEELVNRVLDHSMLEENIQSHRMGAADACTIVSEAVEVMQPRLNGHGKIEVLTTGDEINIFCDRLFLKGVLINLIDNSIKYCDKVPLIKVSIRKESGYAVIEVADNGPGIPEEYRKRIFEKFFRLPSENVHNVKGYGLGLSFAALVMKMHKGSIETGNCNEGCTFILRIPLAV